MSGSELARAAQALAGCGFRLHGRDPATGLDCIGVLAAALTTIGRAAPLPTGYRLRAHRASRAEEWARACGLSPAEGPIRPGDILLVRPGPCQFHLVIALDRHRCVHAHAGRKRVVVTEMPGGWQIVGHWRLQESV
jgi:hypothetical protein